MGAMGEVIWSVYSASKREAAIKRNLERESANPMPDWQRKRAKKALRKAYRVARQERKRLVGGEL